MPEPVQQGQAPELIVTDPEAVSALGNTVFLGEFVHPASPSDVARKLGMPANLAHHHAQKYVRLGLLFEAGREKGKVLYQLAALSFKVRRSSSAQAHAAADTVFERQVRQLAEQLLEACQRSSAQIADPDARWTTCTFNAEPGQLPPSKNSPEELSSEARPAYFCERTLRLTPERYRALLGQIDGLIRKELSDWEDPRAVSCTVSAFAFEGSAQNGLKEGMTRSAYLDLPEATA